MAHSQARRIFVRECSNMHQDSRTFRVMSLVSGANNSLIV